MLQKNSNHSGGFTIIELLIATGVFSVILLVCSSVLIQIGRIYQKNIINSQTHEVARSVIVSVSEAIQFSGGDVSLPGTNGNDPASNGFCIDDKRFSFKKNLKLVDSSPTVDQTLHALVVDNLGGCTSDKAQNLSVASVLGKELLSPNMRIMQLTVCIPGMVATADCPSPSTANSNLYQVIVKIAYGDSDLFDGSGNCISARSGGSFCANSNLSTTVQKRIIR